jgi:hypothetical protein
MNVGDIEGHNQVLNQKTSYNCIGTNNCDPDYAQEMKWKTLVRAFLTLKHLPVSCVYLLPCAAQCPEDQLKQTQRASFIFHSTGQVPCAFGSNRLCSSGGR